METRDFHTGVSHARGREGGVVFIIYRVAAGIFMSVIKPRCARQIVAKNVGAVVGSVNSDP